MEFFLFAIELLEGIGISYVGNLFSNLDYLPICCSWLIRFSINSTKQKQLYVVSSFMSIRSLQADELLYEKEK